MQLSGERWPEREFFATWLCLHAGLELLARSWFFWEGNEVKGFDTVLLFDFIRCAGAGLRESRCY